MTTGIYRTHLQNSLAYEVVTLIGSAAQVASWVENECFIYKCKQGGPLEELDFGHHIKNIDDITNDLAKIKQSTESDRVIDCRHLN